MLRLVLPNRSNWVHKKKRYLLVLEPPLVEAIQDSWIHIGISIIHLSRCSSNRDQLRLRVTSSFLR